MERPIYDFFYNLDGDMHGSAELLAYMTAAFPLNEKETGELYALFTERRIKRRGFLLQQGDVCKHFTFIVSGCFKMYAIDQGGKEHNLEFAIENEWITDLSSFYAEEPGSVFIEAVEPCTVLQISRPNLIYCYSHYPKFNSIFRILTERKYIELQNRVLQNISATAHERYANFVTQFPKLAGRLPNTQIASYLGITSEFLSKVRKDLAHERLPLT